MSSKSEITKKGFVLYSDTLGIALNILKSNEQRGELLTLIYQYSVNEKVVASNDVVNTCFLFVKNSIDISSEKYLKRKKAQKDYYDKKRALSNYDNGNDNGNDIIQTNNNNNNFSLDKYTREGVLAILEKEKIYLKNNHFNCFYRMNETDYKWRFSPEVAARKYIQINPDAVTSLEKYWHRESIRQTPKEPLNALKNAIKENTPPAPVPQNQEPAADPSAAAVWDGIINDYLPKYVNPDTVLTWFKQLIPFLYENETLIMYAPARLVLDVVQKNSACLNNCGVKILFTCSKSKDYVKKQLAEMQSKK